MEKNRQSYGKWEEQRKGRQNHPADIQHPKLCGIEDRTLNLEPRVGHETL